MVPTGGLNIPHQVGVLHNPAYYHTLMRKVPATSARQMQKRGACKPPLMGHEPRMELLIAILIDQVITLDKEENHDHD